MTYNVFGGTLNPAQSNPKQRKVDVVQCNFEVTNCLRVILMSLVLFFTSIK